MIRLRRRGKKENTMNKKEVIEKELSPINGFIMLFVILLLAIGGTVLIIFGGIQTSVIMIVIGLIAWFLAIILMPGLKIIKPNEAKVFTMFGTYYGTISKSGYYYINPFTIAFSSNSKQTELGKPDQTMRISPNISLKTQTLENNRQKVNDILGNPIYIGAIVIWRVDNPTKAVFSVENYKRYLSIQTDSIIRNVARLYPYDVFETSDLNEEVNEKSLRGSSLEIAELMKKELQEKANEAGLIVEDVRITQLAYAEEIAAAMLQRQQAAAIIAARAKIVDGAVGMVKMALDKLSEDEIVVLDDDRKAAMVSNLLVVLCGSQDAQPIVNSGSDH